MVDLTISIGASDRTPYFVDDPDLPAGTLRVHIPDPVPVHRDPPAAPLIGLSPTPAEAAKWHGTIPGAHSARVFYGVGKGQPKMTDPAIAGLFTRGITPHVSTKDPATAEQLRAEFDAVPPGRRYKRTFWHERQGDDIDPAWCLAQDKLIRQVRDDHPRAGDITLVGVHNLWAARFKRLRDWRYFVSSDVDRLGWDCYLDDRFAWEAPESLLGLPIHSLAEFGFVDWEITELGASASHTLRPQWLYDVVDAAAGYGCAEVLLWCSKKTITDDHGRNQVLDYRPTDPAALAMFRDLVALNAGVHA